MLIIRENNLSPFVFTPLLPQNAPTHMQYRALVQLGSFAISVQHLQGYLCAHHRLRMARTVRLKQKQVLKVLRTKFDSRCMDLVSLMVVHWIKRLSV